MGIKVKLKNTTRINIKNRTINSTQTPISIKGTVNSIKSIEDIGDIDEISVANGSTIVYNPDTDKYEIKKLNIENIDGTIAIEFGEF